MNLMDIKTFLLTSVILTLTLTAPIRDEEIIAAITKLSSSGNTSVSIEDEQRLKAILYSPNKCRILPFKQTLRLKQCSEVVISNNFCFGGCPTRTLPMVEGAESGNYKKYPNYRCIPNGIHYVDVLFDCLDGTKKGKSVQIVDSCACSNT